MLGSEDAGKFITFEVTPKNAAAPTTGQAAKAVSQESVMGQPVISVDGSYSNHLPMITIGELTAGSVVTVYDTDGTTILASGTATTDTLTLALNALAPGTHTITANAADSLREASLDSEELEYEVNDIAILPQNHFSLGSNHAIVLDAIGQVLTWGANWNAQIGNGTTTASPNRFTVPNLPSDIIAVQAGFGHSLILTSKGDVWQWGRGSNNTPVKVNGIDHAIAISAEGGTNSLVLKSDGTVWTWGDYSPLVQVPGLDHVLEIQARYASSYVLKADGTVWAWGDNTNGQLGNGTTTSSNVPVQVSGLTNIVSMKMGNQHALALSVTGSVYAWGFNQMGQVGNGTNANQLVPVELEDLPKITLLGAGNYQSLHKMKLEMYMHGAATKAAS